jgi:hypothetical protein
VVPDVDYKGGFSILGSKMFASGPGKNKAKFYFNYAGKPEVKVAADRFLLRKGLLAGSGVEVTIAMKEDSLFHPKVDFRFDMVGRKLTISRENKGLSQAPFTNTYHKMDMILERLEWTLGDPLMTLGNMNMGTGSPMVLESQNYYRGERYDDMRGLSEQNPLVNIKEMVDGYGRRQFTIQEVAEYMRMDLQTASIFLMNMAVNGFVLYNQENSTIEVRQKVLDYVENHKLKRDYDVVRFLSRLSEGTNAQLSLLSMDLDVWGIPAIALSDSQKVEIFPYESKITVQKDLDFKFAGMVRAGRFAFWGRSFFFDYSEFKLDMPLIDSMKFVVESFEKNSLGEYDLIPVKNTLQNIVGDLKIDKPDNKSGRKSYTEYPIFTSYKVSYVFYDNLNIYNGVYNRRDFYVRLQPFEIDSLDNARTKGLKFEGTLVSANIFPDINENLIVMPDYSLGFFTSTPLEGMPAYRSKGKFSNTISLSNKGLKGDGVLDYLTSTSVSDDFIFFPDSARGPIKTFEIRPQMGATEYPHVLAEGSKMLWVPYKDVMRQRNGATPFRIMDDLGMRGFGELYLRPTKLTSNGRLEFLNAEALSRNILLKNKSMRGDTLNFRLKAAPELAWGFEADSTAGRIDFTAGQGQFDLVHKTRKFKFPITQYHAFFDHADWDINARKVEVKKVALSSPTLMLSALKAQDSLQFKAGTGRFTLDNNVLESFNAPEINVADATVFPDSAYVVVDAGAAMRKLLKARVIANRTTRYHEFYNAEIMVKARGNYFGNGYYDYLDEDATPWPLQFATIKVDTAGQTYALSTVKPEDNFYLSPFFSYYGKIRLYADQRQLECDGNTRIEQACPNISTTWFPFKSVVDPLKIIIDLPSGDSVKAFSRLHNGIYIARDSTAGYSAFLSKDNSKGDVALITAGGKLFYDKAITSYVITTQAKLDNPDADGNYLALNNADCTTEGEGVLQFGDATGQFGFNSYGRVTHDLNSDAIGLDVVAFLNFFFPEAVLEAIQKEFAETRNAQGADVSRRAYTLAVANRMKGKDRTKYLEELKTFGLPERIPSELRSTMVFTDLQMEWNKETSSFLSKGDIGLGSILRTNVNKKVFGHIELARKRRGDEVTIYLELSSSRYFYFEYKRGQLQFYTSIDEIMTLITAIDPKDRRQEKEGMEPFGFTVGTKGRVSRFLSRFE